ncbi:MAG: polysaccharide biosynthesis/export family protein [Planctomycetota bacterium]|jgi:protein involved in polysaccharide export with SLBB domain
MTGSIPRTAAGLAIIATLALLPACSSYPSIQAIAAEINSTLQPAPVVLVPGDNIEVKFPDTSEWDHTVTVRPDGRVSFLYLDEVQVSGMTIEALDRTLTRAYRERGLRGLDDQVDLVINLSGGAVRNVIVMGEVGSPGVVAIEAGRLSLIEALGKAGGPVKATADLSEVVLIRWMAKEGRQRVWKIDARISNWVDGVPILLQAHDIIFVHNTTVDDINIWIDQYIRKMIPLPGFIPI